MRDCPICGANEKQVLERRHGVPVFLNRLESSKEEAVAAKLGDLDMVRCQICGFVWNLAFDPNKIVYDAKYENDQTHSTAFNSHLLEMADRALAAVGKGPVDLLEIGCGQGVFMKAVASRGGNKLRSATGFDPAFRNEELLNDCRMKVFKQYFDDASLTLLEHTPNLVVSRHTIEHISNPIGFLSAVRTSLGGVNAIVFIETPDVEWIVSRGEIQDFFYEHCSLFTADSLILALEKAYFSDVSVDRVFNGQYLWARAELDVRRSNDRPRMTRESFSAPDFAKGRQSFIGSWQRRVESARGKVAVWGAGAKGVTFCWLVDRQAKSIAAVVDINPGKQDRYLPVTGHRVIAPTKLQDYGIGTIIVMNPNYRDEITAELLIRGQEIDILVLEGERL